MFTNCCDDTLQTQNLIFMKVPHVMIAMWMLLTINASMGDSEDVQVSGASQPTKTMCFPMQCVPLRMPSNLVCSSWLDFKCGGAITMWKNRRGTSSPLSAILNVLFKKCSWTQTENSSHGWVRSSAHATVIWSFLVECVCLSHPLHTLCSCFHLLWVIISQHWLGQNRLIQTTNKLQMLFESHLKPVGNAQFCRGVWSDSFPVSANQSVNPWSGHWWPLVAIWCRKSVCHPWNPSIFLFVGARIIHVWRQISVAHEICSSMCVWREAVRHQRGGQGGLQSGVFHEKQKLFFVIGFPIWSHSA